MIKFLLRRLIGSIGVVVAISFLAYMLIYLAPGDPAMVIAGQRIGHTPTQKQLEQIREEYGLDKGPVLQYISWLGNALRGDFGYSIRSGTPVIKELEIRLRNTLLLTIVTTFIASIIGIATGFLSAWRENSFWDQGIRTIGLLGVSIPTFWLAFLLILVFSISLGLLPTHGMGKVENLVLPVICLGLADTARLSRLTRSSFLEVRHEDYLLAARARGLSLRNAWYKHGLPNIAVPIVTLIATQFSSIVAGSIIIETLFAWPGIGTYYMNAVSFRDIPVIQTMVVLYGIVFVLLNTLADIASILIDPRIRMDQTS